MNVVFDRTWERMLVGKDCDSSGGSLGRYGTDGGTGWPQFIYENGESRRPIARTWSGRLSRSGSERFGKQTFPILVGLGIGLAAGG